MTQRRRARSVDEYIASQPTDVRGALERVRSAIRRAVPRADETISYGIPAYTLHGHVVIYFAGWKKHYSMYPAKGPVAAAFKHDLAPYDVQNGTIRFPLSESVPEHLITRIVKFRAAAVAGAGAGPGRRSRPKRTQRK
jgi:uncharacterized protein YdhG (YjbR/CyaY superfamily)